MGKKAEIREKLAAMEQENRRLIEGLTGEASLTGYARLVRGENIWTDALQAALNENEVVRIPAGLYLIDGTVTIPSGRHIEAEEGAVIRQAEGVRVLMLRNEHTQDGTHAPISGENRDFNISINGGRWEESWTKRLGYSRTGRYDMTEDGEGVKGRRAFYGVSTCMLFGNMDCLTLTNMTFAHTAGFSVQMGDISNVHCENIAFVECFADGLHINGNTENVITRGIHGQVGDDLVALNMYDWQNSSINFGPMKTVLCEDMELSADSPYKAMRIEPGTYYYDDGSSVDCSLTDAIISGVRGINVYKMYYQTPAYRLGEEPERGDVGSGDNIFFENIVVDLDSPSERMDPYLNSDPVRGHFAAFEINSNIGHISFENISLTRYDCYPLSHLVTVGPKSVLQGDIEIFDPYLSSEVGEMSFRGITVNGENPEDIAPYVHVTVFDRLYEEYPSSGAGKIGAVRYEKKPE